MFSKRYALLAILLLVTPVHAEWAREAYDNEHNDCVKACDKNNPSEHGKCVSYCDCAIGDIQTQFPDHELMVREAAQQKLPKSRGHPADDRQYLQSEGLRQAGEKAGD
jgi:hypothetical protein